MKPLFSNLKSPITTFMGLSLFALTLFGLYNGKFDFWPSGTGFIVLSAAFCLFNDKEIKRWLSQAFKALLSFLTKSAPILAVLILVSCGVVKNVKRDKEKTKTETDSTAHVKAKTELVEKEQTTTVTTIQADTSATAKGSTVKGSTPLKQLYKKPFVLEDKNQTITVSTDSAGNLQVNGVVKDRTVNLQFKKRIEEKLWRDRNTVTKTDSKVSESKTASSESKTTDKDVKRTASGWVSMVLVILFLLVMVYLTLRKKIPFLP